MKQKDMYTLEELYSNLKISLSKLSKLSGINEGTLARIRKGYSARVETVNKLLEAFSETYGIEFSRENVSGFTLEDKKAIRNRSLMSQGITEKAIEPPIDNKMAVDIKPVSGTQKHIVAPSEGTILLKDFADLSGIPLRTLHNWREAGRIEASHRDRPGGGGIEYLISPDQQEKARQIRAEKPGKQKHAELPAELPAGSILASKFAEAHGVRPSDFEEHLRDGLGKGRLIGMSTDTIPQRDPVDYSEREIRGKKERYLTSAQQAAAIALWHKHDVAFEPCDQTGCQCRIIKSSKTETGDQS